MIRAEIPDADRHVVQGAKPLPVVGKGVVGPTGQISGNSVFQGRAHGPASAFHLAGATFKELRRGGQTQNRFFLGREFAPRQTVEVFRGVDTRQVFPRRGFNLDHIFLFQNPRRAQHFARHGKFHHREGVSLRQRQEVAR